MDPGKREESGGPAGEGPDVSVVLTAHGEGRLAHRSVRSAQRTMAPARELGVRIEFLAILDSPSPETRAYFERHRSAFDAIHEVAFRDLARTRNAGVERSLGRYVAFLDADDLFSESWIDAAFRMAERLGGERGRSVLHPSHIVEFGNRLGIFEGCDGTDPGFDSLALLQGNYWTAMVFVAREVARAIPYEDSIVGSGFGYEDWHWNCETVAAGVVHRVVPGTAHFIRRKEEGSLLVAHTKARAVIRPSRLFRPPLAPRPQRSEAAPRPVPDPVPVVPPQPAVPAPDGPAQAGGPVLLVLRWGYRLLRFPYRLLLKPLFPDPGRVGRFVHALRGAFRDLILPPPPPPPPRPPPPPPPPAPPRPVPGWLLAEWRAINEIEPDLCPARQVTPDLAWYAVPPPTIVGPYVLAQGVRPEAPSHILLAPWLKRGGADLVTLHYARALSGGGLGRGVLCVLTEDTDSPWADRLPSEVGVIPFGSLARSLSSDDRAYLLLTPTGFTTRTLLASKSFRWAEVEQFGTLSVKGTTRVIFTLTAEGRLRYTESMLRKLNKAMSGGDEALADTYGRSAEALADLMTQWKNKVQQR